MEHATDEIKRTCEIEEFTNTYIIHPISSWLVPQFIKHNITPNMVSLFGMVCGIMAGYLLLQLSISIICLCWFYTHVYVACL